MKYSVSYTINASRDFDESDLINLVGEDKFNKIKSSRPGGIFKTFIFAHETVASPNVIGKGTQAIQFGKEAVMSAIEKIKNGAKVFWKHDKHNNNNRPSVGEVVASGSRETDDGLQALAVAWFPPETAKYGHKANAVSMEAVWNLIKDEAGKLIADSVDAIKGLAVFDTDEGIRPGFDGAFELASIQAHTIEEEEKKMTEPVNGFTEFRDFRKAAKEFNAHATDIWKADQIVGTLKFGNNNTPILLNGDRNVVDYIETEIIKPILESAHKEIESLRRENSEIKKELRAFKSRPEIEKLAREKGLPERVIKLAQRNIDKLATDSEIDYNKFLEDQVKEDEHLRSLGYGIPEPTPDKKPALGTAPSVTESEKNPFLPEDER